MSYPSISSKFDIISKMGQGGYGIVYKAREIQTKDIVALKQIKKVLKNNEGFPQPALREILLLRDLKGCPNVVDLRDVITCDQERNVYIVYNHSEYDLTDVIYNQMPLTLQHIKSYLKQMIIGLDSIHSKGYMHRDIKPNNFLISSDNYIILIDFGLSRKIDQSNYDYKRERLTDHLGTFSYRAPEVIMGSKDYGLEIDIWSLGCTLYEMLTCENLFSKCVTDAEIAVSIVQLFGFPNEKEWPEFNRLSNRDLFIKCKRRSAINIDNFLESKLPEEFKSMKGILLKMLQLNPKKRLSTHDLLEDPILADAESPENLPPLSIEEYFTNGNGKKSNRQTISLQKEIKRMKKMGQMYEKLRLPKILPHDVI